MSDLKNLLSEFESNPKEDFKISIPKSFAVLLLIVICLQFLGGFINWPTKYWPSTTNILLPLSFFAGGILAIFVLLSFVNTNWISIKKHLLNPTSIALILLSVFLYVFLLPFTELLSSIIPTDGNEFISRLYREVSENFENILNYKIAGFITVCLFAPFIEEILFRGILLRGLLQNGIQPIMAIILSSFLFGIAHLNPWQFIGAGFLGAIFGFVYYRTKALWLCIFLHGLNNTISFIYMVKENGMEGNVSNPNNFIQVSVFFLLAVFCAWLIFILTRNKPSWS